MTICRSACIWLLPSLLPVVYGNSDHPSNCMSWMSARLEGQEANDSSFVSKFKSRFSRQGARPSQKKGNPAMPASWGFGNDTNDDRDSSSPNNRDRLSPLRYLSSYGENSTDSSDKSQLPLGDVLSLSSSEGTTPRHPVVYRYYGRNQALTHSYGSIPFLLLGPNVDHWKVAGQELSSRGYNAIACERVLTEEDVVQASKAAKAKSSSSSSPSSPSGPDMLHVPSWNESALLVVQLLDALRWNKAVLVACDSLTLVAIEAAMLLAPHRIAGVVLCGSIPSLDDLLPKEDGVVAEEIRRRLAGSYNSVDQFLKRHVRCPSTIVWDGAIPPVVDTSGSSAGSSDDLSSTAAESIASGRSLILGGGSAPHRRRPELFAWALTRFVEEHIDPQRHRKEELEKQRQRRKEEARNEDETDQLPWNERKLPFHLALIFSPGSMVVYGRILATALFYGIVMKTLIFQYENIRWGIFNVKAKIDMIVSLPRRIMRAVSGLFRNSLLVSVPKSLLATLSSFLPFRSRGAQTNNESSGSDDNGTRGSGSDAIAEADEVVDSEVDANKTNETSLDEQDDESAPSDDDDQDMDDSSASEEADGHGKDSEPQRPMRPIMFLDHVVV